MTEILIPKNAKDTLRLALEDYKGHRLAAMRVWFDPGQGDPLRPRREGFAVNVALLPRVIDGLQQLQAEAERVGWLASPPPSGAVPCEVCGTPFKPSRADAKCCSPKCRAKASRTRRAGNSDNRTEAHVSERDDG